MSDNRRNFLGKLGVGFAAALAVKPLVAAGVKALPTISNVPVDLVGPLQKELTGNSEKISFANPPEILRVAHNNSVWVNKGQVEPGHFFTHKWLSTECVDIGSALQCSGQQHVGWKAMKFNLDNMKQGAEPNEVYDLPRCWTTSWKSEEYKRIVKASEGPQPNSIGCLHGPVIMFTTYEDKQLELFCHNKVLRDFAYNSMFKFNHKGSFTLKLVRIKSPKGWSWFVPKVVIK